MSAPYRESAGSPCPVDHEQLVSDAVQKERTASERHLIISDFRWACRIAAMLVLAFAGFTTVVVLAAYVWPK